MERSKPYLDRLATSIVLATVALSPTALRAGECSTLPNPVYVTGSTAAKPLLIELGKYLSTQSSPITIVYLGQGSCTGVDAILNGTPIQGSGNSAPSTWDATGTEKKCDVTTPVVADIGISDVFATTCFSLPGGLAGNVADFLGPVQSMTFAVPIGSPENAISAEAAYYVYGFGNDSGVLPWTDETVIFKRDANSGTQRMIAAAIGVPADRWKGTASTGSSDLLQKLTLASTRPKAIGILAADVAQDNRTVLKVLAYQHGKQACGYFPDRDATSNEKANVRDGHYAIWGPLHLLTRLDNNGYPLKPAASDVIGYLTGSKTAPGQLDLIFLEAQRHVIPQCAMRVKRSQELGPMTPFAPVGACGCYYEKVANGATSCTPCQRQTDCPTSTPVCSHGYCERS
jgi:ABC-type phosphate transport system substrate-binding protein